MNKDKLINKIIGIITENLVDGDGYLDAVEYFFNNFPSCTIYCDPMDNNSLIQAFNCVHSTFDSQRSGRVMAAIDILRMLDYTPWEDMDDLDHDGFAYMANKYGTRISCERKYKVFRRKANWFLGRVTAAAAAKYGKLFKDAFDREYKET